MPDTATAEHPVSEQRRTWVISAGSGLGRRHGSNSEQLIRKFFPADQVIRTRDRRHLTGWSPGLPDHGVVIVAGGDGAWREALQGAPEQVIPGLLPVGTVSQAAIELNTAASPQAWRQWRCEQVQLGQIRSCLHASGERTKKRDAAAHADHSRSAFFLMAGIGVESDAVQIVRPGLKRWIGKWAYVWALLERLMRPVRRSLVVDLDGRRFRTSQVLIQNGAHYGGRYRVADTDIRQPNYRILIWKYPGRFMWCLTMMCLMFRLPSGWLAHKLPGVEAHIRSSRKQQCQIDGDIGPALPLYVMPTTSRKVAIADTAQR